MTKVFDSLNERKLKTEKSNRTFTLVIGVIVAIMLTLFILFSTVFYFVTVEGTSMQNTLQSGDGVLVNRCATVERGDIVVINKTAIKEQQIVLEEGKFDLSKLNYPCAKVIKVTNGFTDFEWSVNDNILHVKNPMHSITIEYRSNYSIIKRVIGLEGDEIKLKDGKVYVKQSGQAEFKQLKEDYIKIQNSTFSSPGQPSEWVVGKNQVFYLGDNRTVSEDSTEDGCCNISAVQGVVSEFSIETKGFTTWLSHIFG